MDEAIFLFQHGEMEQFMQNQFLASYILEIRFPIQV